MRTRLATLALLIGALFALVLLAGCGGDDSGGSSSDSDPQEVLDTALGGDQQIDSGVLDLSFDVESTGSSPGSINASLQGPFQSTGEGTLPEIDFTASASVEAADTSFDFDGGLIVTADGAFVSYNGTDYQVDDATFALLQSSYEQSSQLQASQAESSGSLQALGIDPATWVTDLTNEGTEDLDGTEVVHVSGTADVGKIVEDLTSVAEQTGQTAQLDQDALQQVQDSVTNATIDVYANTEDDTLRQLDLSLDVEDPSGDGTVTIDLSIGIADPNSDQEITGPSDAQPLAELLNQIPGGAEALSGLGSLGGSTGGGAVPPSGGGAAADYYDCAAGAQSADDLQACADLLN